MTLQAIDSARIVLLPAANDYGFYWFSSPNGGNAYVVVFDNSTVSPANGLRISCNRNDGRSLRLVADCR